jgi:DNA-binding XRE family transcriptional regulator
VDPFYRARLIRHLTLAGGHLAAESVQDPDLKSAVTPEVAGSSPSLPFVFPVPSVSDRPPSLRYDGVRESVLRSFYKCQPSDPGSVGVVPRADYADPPPELARLGSAIRMLRERQGLKQIEVATAAGMTESQVSDIERGQNNPGWILVVRLVVNGIGVSLSEFAVAYEESSAG